MRGVPDDYGQASYDIFYGFLICPGGGCTEANLTSDNDKCRAPDYANQMFGGYSMVYNRVYDPDDDGYGVPTLFLYSSTGGHVELTEGDNPSFDYSGRWVVFQDEDYDIARIEVGGSGDPVKLTTGYGDFNPDVWWQNDRIVFHRNGLNGYRGLCLVSMDGTGFEVLLEDRWDQYYAAWSPDCTMIAFTGHRMGNFDIYIYEVP
jgi:Tol biopolymer transport system component